MRLQRANPGPVRYAPIVPRFIRGLLTLALCISLMPGWTEVLENLEHLVHDGHLAHRVEHNQSEGTASHKALEAEHGSHTCGCHFSVPILLPDNDLDFGSRATVVLRERPPGLDDLPVHRANAPPVPPPGA